MTAPDLPAPPAVPPEVARRAVEWLVELRSGEPGAATQAALQRWLAAHPDHERAWHHVAVMDARWRGLASPAASAAAQAVLARPRSAGRRRAVKTFALLACTGGGMLAAGAAAPWDSWLADERTGTGERRRVRLADGSTVLLNSGSAMHVDTMAHRVRLAAGEILVTMPALRTLPLAIETPHGMVHALGARLAVRLLGGACRVWAFTGNVEIRTPAGAHMRLAAGTATRFGTAGIDTPVPADDSVTAWADGMLIGGGMRLDAFLDELARHRPGIVYCDPAVAHLRVAGTYPLADTDRVLRALAAVLPVRISHVTRYWVAVRPR